MNGRLLTLAVVLLMASVAIVPMVTVADEARGSRAINEVEAAGNCPNNDNWNCAMTAFTVAGSSGEATILGDTSLGDPNRNDYFKLEGIKTGMVINASVFVASSAGFQDQVVSIELYNQFHQDKIAWSESGHTFEALTAVAVLEGTWYLRVIPLKDDSRLIIYYLNIKAEYPEEIDLTALSPGQEVLRTVPVSNQTDRPGQWFRLKMSAGQTVNDVANVTMAGYDPVNDGQFDLYLRDLRGNSWSNWHNISWWGEDWPLGGTGRIEESDMAASHTTSGQDMAYYVDVQAWNGTGTPTLYFARKTIASDGDNTPETATQIVRTPGMSKFVHEGNIHWSYDKYDWYKFSLKDGESMSASIFLKNQTPAIYRVSIHTLNTTTGDDRINVVHSVSNLDSGQVEGFATASVVDSVEKEYYIRVMAQVPLFPSNFSNLADWHANRATADYTLEVDLPDRDTEPTVVSGAPDSVFVAEDTAHQGTILNDIFDDVDIGDPELDDALSYSIINTPLHLEAEIDTDTSALILRPEADWSGQDYTLLRATDLYGKFVEHNLTIVVTNVDDAPMVLPGAADLLRPFHVRHGEVNTTFANISVASLFADADIEFAGDSLSFSVTSSTEDADIRARITAANNLEFDTAIVSSNDPGPFLVPLRVTATDTTSLQATHEVNVTVYPDEGIVQALPSPPPVTIEEGGSVSVDLADYFVQTRGKDLKYAVQSSDSPNITVEFNDDDTATISSSGDFTTAIGVGLTLRAWTEVPFSEATNNIVVFVTDVADAPVITGAIPDLDLVGEITIAEDIDNEFFQITVDDVDTPTNKLKYFWFVDDVLVSQLGRSWSYEPDFDAAGTHTVTVKVQDDAGLTDEESWPVTVTNTNRKPTVTIITPLNNSQQDSKSVKFIAEAVDPDGGALTFEWSEAGTPLAPPSSATATNDSAATSTVELEFKRGSTHQIDLVVTDADGEKVRRSVTISIKAGDVQTPGFELIAVVAATALAVAVVSRRREVEE